MRHAESRVRVTYRIDPERCWIDIEDDGPGVPEEAWERVFTPFLRLDDSRTRASGGHGLGLSIVRRIIYWHGGRCLRRAWHLPRRRAFQPDVATAPGRIIFFRAGCNAHETAPSSVAKVADRPLAP